MPGWVWALIIAGVVIVVALVVWQALKAKRTRTLQGRFGPEYDRTLERADDRREAEADLAARAKRRDELDIRPLPSASRERYLEEWQRVQARFVDDPSGAVQEADSLIQSVMRERGYPVEGFDEQASLISVDHPDLVENYRAAHALRERSRNGATSTEDLRDAMLRYRSLFDELLAPV